MNSFTIPVHKVPRQCKAQCVRRSKSAVFLLGLPMTARDYGGR